MNKVKKTVLLSIAVLAVGLANSSCDNSGDVVTTPKPTVAPTVQPTAVPLGDDVMTETVDGVREFLRGLETVGIIGGEND